MQLVALMSLFRLLGNTAALPAKSSAWTARQFKNLVTFGDSYTDESRYNYFWYNNWTQPPAGTFLPEAISTPGGGRTWARYVVQYAGSKRTSSWDPKMTLYDYAISGASCSNKISPYMGYPDVTGNELPEYLRDLNSVRNGTDTAYYDPARTTRNTVYTMWIGTNDVGQGGFLTDSQILGYTLSDYIDCVFDILDAVYATGARYFVVFNLAPLHLVPLYSNSTCGGEAGPNHYFLNKGKNLTDIAERMRETVTTLNRVYKYRIAYENRLAHRYPNAHFVDFDVYSLIHEMYVHPTRYLNGTAETNVTGYYKHCDLNGTTCTYYGDSPDSFLWFDELHPSEQADRVIAKEFLKVLNGRSKYATYW